MLALHRYSLVQLTEQCYELSIIIIINYYYYYPHFTVEEIETQRVSLACPWSHRWEEVKPELKLGTLTLENSLLATV